MTEWVKRARIVRSLTTRRSVSFECCLGVQTQRSVVNNGPKERRGCHVVSSASVSVLNLELGGGGLPIPCPVLWRDASPRPDPSHDRRSGLQHCCKLLATGLHYGDSRPECQEASDGANTADTVTRATTAPRDRPNNRHLLRAVLFLRKHFPKQK